MKTQTIIFSDTLSLINGFEAYEVKPASSLQTLARKICSLAKVEKVKTVIIKFSIELVAPSYRGLPAMFAQTMAGHTTYRIIQSYCEDGNYLVFRASNKRRPATFRERGIKAIKRFGIYSKDRTEIPKTYRIRPGVFKKILELETNKKIATIAKPNKITWRIKKQIVDDDDDDD